jgi:hypothetical protein
MSTQIGYIDTELKTDNFGQIKRNYGLDSRKDQISTFCKITDGEVPFSTFGNRMINMIFHATTEENIKTFLNQLIIEITELFTVRITDYDAVIDVDKIKLKLYIQYDNKVDTIDFIISNKGEILLG